MNILRKSTHYNRATITNNKVTRKTDLKSMERGSQVSEVLSALSGNNLRKTQVDRVLSDLEKNKLEMLQKSRVALKKLSTNLAAKFKKELEKQLTAEAEA